MPKADRLYIDEKDVDLYKKIENEDMFGGRENKDKFLLAMTIGFKNKVKRPLEKRKDYVLASYLNAEDLTLMNAVAIDDTNSIEVLSDTGRVFKIAEEYAHAGIRILIDKIEFTQLGSFEKQFEKELFEMHNKIILDD